MRCYGLTIPGSDHRLITPTLPPSLSFRPTTIPMTRISFGASFPKLKATFNDGMAAEERSFYDLLGIPESGSLMDIKRAYKQLARKYHPDVSPPDRVKEYTKRFIQVQEAYETLSDPSRRIMYDRDMAIGIHLAFNACKCYNHSDQVSEQKGDWKSQLAGLQRRSDSKVAAENMSWAARVRQQRGEL
ncbi:chaperone protein dnaJ 20, chloroplastic-like [Medicago truncatula]|uniref:chaperone protein dnaJ 20, chloroplastic-like n=1 Tax=Medicago truncatula TaxID=3880 RepID=UPI000D2F3560|nr:chaperone protein dnaJ 20, chloroplastic-like [Medicago truncatula]